ncbi:MAG: hypothetical protein L0170_03260 [Acidobacteria bacterium]|nr:hypothetical protein [Acidobacteriota bacterium]
MTRTASERTLIWGISLTSFCILVSELTLTRIFSVTLGYHFAFMAISIALFGLGVSGILVYVKKEWFPEDRLALQLSRSAMLLGVSLVFTLLLLLDFPFSPESVIALAIIYLVSALPYFFGGLCLALAYTHRHRWISRLYSADLLGAACGCLLLTLLLNALGGPSTVLLIGLLAQVAALLFGRGHENTVPERARAARWLVRLGLATGVLCLIGGIASRFLRGMALRIGESWFQRIAPAYGLPNTFQWYVDQYLGKELDSVASFVAILSAGGLLLAIAAVVAGKRAARQGTSSGTADRRSHLLLPTWIAGVMTFVLALQLATNGIKVRFAQGVVEPPVLYEKWNSISRIKVSPQHGWESSKIFAWGLSKTYAGPEIDQLRMDIDSTAAMPMIHFAGDLSAPEADHLKYDVSSMGFYLTKEPSSLIIGPGGGRDILTSLVFSARSVLGVELNPAILNAVNNIFGDYTGRLYKHPNVRFVLGEGRSFLKRSRDRYDIIQISLIDTWAALSRGALSISENTLYTQEAFDDYFAHLSDPGVLAFTRWWEDTPVHLFRMLNMVTASLQELGEDPAKNLIIIRGPLRGRQDQGRVANMIATRKSLSDEAVRSLLAKAEELQFDVVYAPGEPGFPEVSAFIRNGAEYRRQVAESLKRDIAAVNDDRPFFFYTTKPAAFFRLEPAIFDESQVSITMLSRLLYLILVLVILFMYGPLFLLKRQELKTLGSGRKLWLLYFACLGLGYILVELVMVQRFILFLGHPTYAVTVVIFTMLSFSGIGSLVSGRLAVEALPQRLPQVLGLVVAILLATLLILPAATSAFFHFGLAARIVVALALVAPAGFCMGMPFALAVRLVGRDSATAVPWMWGINGSASVLGSILAACLSMNLGFTATYWTGVAAYLVALVTAAGVTLVLSRGIRQPAAAG